MQCCSVVCAVGSAGAAQPQRSGAGLRLLQTTVKAPHQSGNVCRHPSKPAQKRNLAAFTEPCLELVVFDVSGNPACPLPLTVPHNPELLALVSLHDLAPRNLLSRLAAVETYVAAVCDGDACSPFPSSCSALCDSPEFNSFLERCLEVAETGGMGPAPTLALLRILSHLRMGDPATQLHPATYRNYYLYLAVALDEAVVREPEAMTPAAYVGAYEAWARMAANGLPTAPIKTTAFGSLLRGHLKAGRFTPEELSRLLVTLAKLHTTIRSYRPCTYDTADLAAELALRLHQLSPQQLTAAATACGAFGWPVYQCLVLLLESVAEEAQRRAAAGELSRAAAAAVLVTVCDAAASMLPRLGREMRERFVSVS